MSRAAPAAVARAVAAGRAAWGLLTVLGGATAPSADAAWAYGLVGAVLGGVLGVAWWGLAGVLPALVAAAVVVALDAALTGMLHLDGLADSGDGLLAPMSRARRLEVMRRPDVGAFGVVVVVLAVLLRVSALAALTGPAELSAAAPAGDPLLLVAVWAGSRAAMAAIGGLLPYARAGAGLGASYADRRAHRTGALVGAVPAVIAACLSGADALAALVGVALAAVAVGALAQRRLGGYTGDVLGAVVVTAETVGLVVASGVR